MSAAEPKRRWWIGLGPVVAASVVLAAWPAAARGTVIGFDDLPGGTVVGEQYAALGVHFGPSPFPTVSSAATVTAKAQARSAPNVAAFGYAVGTDRGSVWMRFDRPQARVTFHACNSGAPRSPNQVNVLAYGANGSEIESARQDVDCTADGPLLPVTVTAPGIVWINAAGNGSGFALDDLTFDADPAPLPPAAIPTEPDRPRPAPAPAGKEVGRSILASPVRTDLRGVWIRRGTPPLVEAYTEHLGLLVTAPGRGGRNPLGGSSVMRGTDLGAPFELDGRLTFLFGDSWMIDGAPGQDDDSLAWTTAPSVDRFRMPPLSFYRLPFGTFWPLRITGPLAFGQGGMEVPVEGIRDGGRAYVFFVTGFREGGPCCSTYERSVVASAPAGALTPGSLRVDQRVRTNRFLNVSAVRYGGAIYVFGAGNPYRGSPIYLARVKPGQLGNRGSWTYLNRILYGNRGLFRGPSASNANPIVPDRCVGEFSVRRHAATGLFLMTYNCGGPPRGYYLRMAPTPWGPWSRAQVIMDAGAGDGGYFVSQHFALQNYRPGSDSWEVPDDGLAEPDNLGKPPPRDQVADPAPTGRGVFGGEYGPYLVPRWFRTFGDRHEIVYLHSTWNPYKVHLMRTVLVERGTPKPPPPAPPNVPAAQIANGSFANGLSGWQVIPGTRFHIVAAKGRRYATTYDFGGAGDNAQGAIYQDFTPGPNQRTLAFRVHGGHVTSRDFQRRAVASVRLYHNGEIVRETFGLDRNDRDVNAEWNIAQYRGRPLRLVVADNATGPWGFISATGFELR